MPAISDQPLRILHAVRAPVGGIFRHILDLANGQADRGHHVGLIADSLTGGDRAPTETWGPSPPHSPRSSSHRRSGVDAFHAADPPAETGRPAWTWRQSRRFHSHEDPFEKIHSRLYAAWRLAALPPGYAEGRAL